MPNKVEKNLSEFWESKTGKNILGYGGFLKFCGIASCIINIVAFFLILANEEVYLLPIGYVSYLYAFCSSIYLAVQGDRIKKKELSPQQLNSVCSTIILLMTLSVILMAVVAGGSGRVLSIAGAITLIEAIRYKAKWHKIYEQAYSDNTFDNKEKLKEKLKEKVKVAKEPSTKEKQNNIKDDEFYDEEF